MALGRKLRKYGVLLHKTSFTTIFSSPNEIHRAFSYTWYAHYGKIGKIYGVKVSYELKSAILLLPAYGVFISQLIRYARACSSYECFILRARRLSSKLLKQGYLVERLKSSFRKFYGRYGDLIEQYGVTLSRILNDILTLDQQWLPYRSDFPPISWPLYRAWPSPNYEWFPWSICNGCG